MAPALLLMSLKLPLSPLGASLQPHPPPRLHRGRLDRGMCVLHAVPEGIVALVGEPGVGLSLQGGELGG
jgi:hypothetical protein